MKGNRLKLLREEKGLNQRELAKLLSLSASAIGMYERDFREPNDDVTIKIADFFGVSTDYLLGKSDVRNPEKVDFDPDKLRIGLSVKDYNNITPTQIKQIEEFAKLVLQDNKKEKENKK